VESSIINTKVMDPGSEFLFTVPEENNNTRLDMYVSKQFSSYSRTYFQKLINENHVLINGTSTTKPGYIVRINDKISVKFPVLPPRPDLKVIDIDLGIELIHEHPDFLIVYKPAGIIVHPVNTKNSVISLVDWLLQKFSEISQVGSPERPGIVHRLDMLTSGLLIVPRNNYALATFSDMFKNRLMNKTYLALVEGYPDKNDKSGCINYSIARHPSGSKMMHIKVPRNSNNAREAITNYKVVEYLNNASLVEVKPVTGRTHQIRVHFSAVGNPIIGDVLYGKQSKIINRQALHAYKLEFEYENKQYSFQRDMPEDMLNLLEQLRK